MGERRQRPVSGESEMDNADSGLGRDGDVTGGRPVSEIPRLRPRTNRRCSETPLSEASDEVGRWVGSLTCLAGGLVRGSLARLSFVDCFPQLGRPGDFPSQFGYP
jgi:hypothetical protein